MPTNVTPDTDGGYGHNYTRLNNKPLENDHNDVIKDSSDIRTGTHYSLIRTWSCK